MQTVTQGGHRKLVRRFDEPGHAHELTFSCYHRLPLLANERWCGLLTRSIDAAMASQGFEFVAFVYMPEHVHLVVFPATDDARISSLLFAIKRPFSFRVKRELERGGHPLLETLTVRERPGKMAFRFWQEGGGYDRNITSLRTLRTTVDYVHANPVRRGLCDSADQWKWSSWRYYHDPDKYMPGEVPVIHGFPS